MFRDEHGRPPRANENAKRVGEAARGKRPDGVHGGSHAAGARAARDNRSRATAVVDAPYKVVAAVICNIPGIGEVQRGEVRVG